MLKDPPPSLGEQHDVFIGPLALSLRTSFRTSDSDRPGPLGPLSGWIESRWYN